MKKHFSRRALLLAALLPATLLGSQSLRAHEAPCPYCEIDLVQDTP